MIDKIYFQIASFRFLWLFLPLLLTFLYLVQGGIGIYVYEDKPAFEFVWILMAGLMIHAFVYHAVTKHLLGSKWRFLKEGYDLIVVDHFVALITFAYFALTVYALLTSERIALWEALSGASTSVIAEAREMMFKTRVGWERLLTYGNALFSTALMPFAIALSYVERKRYRHLLLAAFLLSLLPTLEKGLVLKALLPLIILAANGYLLRHRSLHVAIIAVGVIILTLSLSKMGGSDSDLRKRLIENSQEIPTALRKLEEDRKIHLQARSDSQESLKRLIQQREDQLKKIKEKKKSLEIARSENSLDLEFWKKDLKAHQVLLTNTNHWINLTQLQLDQAENLLIYDQNVEKHLHAELENNKEQVRIVAKYQVFQDGGQWAFLANRILWIPYITAYDWLHYFHNKLGGEYLHGRTSLVLSLLTGQSQFLMEKEIFKYQFGYASTATASANACFLVDAFVNFGWIGVLIYASIFAALTGFVVVLNNPAMNACYYYFAFQASISGLSGILFSNGLLLLLLLAVFIRPKSLPMAHV